MAEFDGAEFIRSYDENAARALASLDPARYIAPLYAAIAHRRADIAQALLEQPAMGYRAPQIAGGEFALPSPSGRREKERPAEYALKPQQMWGLAGDAAATMPQLALRLMQHPAALRPLDKPEDEQAEAVNLLGLVKRAIKQGDNDLALAAIAHPDFAARHFAGRPLFAETVREAIDAKMSAVAVAALKAYRPDTDLPRSYISDKSFEAAFEQTLAQGSLNDLTVLLRRKEVFYPPDQQERVLRRALSENHTAAADAVIERRQLVDPVGAAMQNGSGDEALHFLRRYPQEVRSVNDWRRLLDFSADTRHWLLFEEMRGHKRFPAELKAEARNIMSREPLALQERGVAIYRACESANRRKQSEWEEDFRWACGENHGPLVTRLLNRIPNLPPNLLFESLGRAEERRHESAISAIVRHRQYAQMEPDILAAQMLKAAESGQAALLDLSYRHPRLNDMAPPKLEKIVETVIAKSGWDTQRAVMANPNLPLPLLTAFARSAIVHRQHEPLAKLTANPRYAALNAAQLETLLATALTEISSEAFHALSSHPSVAAIDADGVGRLLVLSHKHSDFEAAELFSNHPRYQEIKPQALADAFVHTLKFANPEWRDRLAAHPNFAGCSEAMVNQMFQAVRDRAAEEKKAQRAFDPRGPYQALLSHPHAPVAQLYRVMQEAQAGREKEIAAAAVASPHFAKLTPEMLVELMGQQPKYDFPDEAQMFGDHPQLSRMTAANLGAVLKKAASNVNLSTLKLLKEHPQFAHLSSADVKATIAAINAWRNPDNDYMKDHPRIAEFTRGDLQEVLLSAAHWSNHSLFAELKSHPRYPELTKDDLLQLMMKAGGRWNTKELAVFTEHPAFAHFTHDELKQLALQAVEKNQSELLSVIRQHPDFAELTVAEWRKMLFTAVDKGHRPVVDELGKYPFFADLPGADIRQLFQFAGRREDLGLMRILRGHAQFGAVTVGDVCTAFRMENREGNERSFAECSPEILAKLAHHTLPNVSYEVRHLRQLMVAEHPNFDKCDAEAAIHLFKTANREGVEAMRTAAGKHSAITAPILCDMFCEVGEKLKESYNRSRDRATMLSLVDHPNFKNLTPEMLQRVINASTYLLDDKTEEKLVNHPSFAKLSPAMIEDIVAKEHAFAFHAIAAHEQLPKLKKETLKKMVEFYRFGDGGIAVINEIMRRTDYEGIPSAKLHTFVEYHLRFPKESRADIPLILARPEFQEKAESYKFFHAMLLPAVRSNAKDIVHALVAHPQFGEATGKELGELLTFAVRSKLNPSDIVPPIDAKDPHLLQALAKHKNLGAVNLASRDTYGLDLLLKGAVEEQRLYQTSHWVDFLGALAEKNPSVRQAMTPDWLRGQSNKFGKESEKEAGEVRRLLQEKLDALDKPAAQKPAPEKTSARDFPAEGQGVEVSARELLQPSALPLRPVPPGRNNPGRPKNLAS